MEIDTISFVPPGVAIEALILLVMSSAATAMLTSMAGVGGGVLLLGIMAWLVPTPALIPIHGVVQFGAASSRTIIGFADCNRTLILQFLIGSLLGGALATIVAMPLSPSFMQLCLAAFILWSAWMKPPAFLMGRFGGYLNGAVTTFLSFFVGAAGPLSGAALKAQGLKPVSFIATKSAFGLIQNGVKIAAFGLTGFAFGPYLPLAMTMILAGFVGSYAGTLFLMKIEERWLRLGLSCMLTVLATGMALKASSGLLVDVQTMAVANENQLEVEPFEDQESALLAGKPTSYDSKLLTLENDLKAAQLALTIVDARAEALREERNHLVETSQAKDRRIELLTGNLATAEKLINDLSGS